MTIKKVRLKDVEIGKTYFIKGTNENEDKFYEVVIERFEQMLIHVYCKQMKCEFPINAWNIVGVA